MPSLGGDAPYNSFFIKNVLMLRGVGLMIARLAGA
jgi:hypothetical protein